MNTIHTIHAITDHSINLADREYTCVYFNFMTHFECFTMYFNPLKDRGLYTFIKAGRGQKKSLYTCGWSFLCIFTPLLLEAITFYIANWKVAYLLGLIRETQF